jgi:hypothetical protein
MPLVTFRIFALLLACILTTPAIAAPVPSVEPRLPGASAGDDAKVCAKLARAAEKALGIPDHLLRAVGVVESGRYDHGLGRTEPWPWTINAEGDGAMFRSKADAVAKVSELRANGVKSIDVGCMQVNLAYHGDAFENLEEAFDPVMNVAYAAHFLTSLKEERGSWNAAVAAYHSSTPKFGIPYRQKVAKTWHGLRGAITQDRIQARREAVAAAYQKRKAEFEAHQARVLEAQKAKREARQREKAKAQGENAVEELRGETTPDAPSAEAQRPTMPEQTALAAQPATEAPPTTLRCDVTAMLAAGGGKRRFDPALARQIMQISASGALDDGFLTDDSAALGLPAIPQADGAIMLSTAADGSLPGTGSLAADIAETETASGADGLRPGCPRLIEHQPVDPAPGTSPIVIRG